MGASSWLVYDSFIYLANTGLEAVSTSTYKLRLLTDTYVPDASHTMLTEWSFHSVGSGNGYVAPGAEIDLSFVPISGGSLLMGTDVEWIATGGSIIAAYAGIYNTVTETIVSVFALDDTSIPITVPDGEKLLVNSSAYGIMEVIRP